ncbi:alpha/beta hydrolase, partial [Klebsiella pneumoniae]|uniref:alpha/beta fold hydrolase n=1 Tax=Klebsiella pneumoniae TaxID=573 RepID=UPI002998D2A4|nr:alpha/beta hydrolase [Klebsiella pneumoniae]
MQYRQNEVPLADLAAEHVYLQVNGRRLHCVVAGEGRPVLLIPGWPQTGYT